MTDKLCIMVTGGAGFIGSAVCRHLIGLGSYRVVNVDKLTYSGCLASLDPIAGSPDYIFYQADILETDTLRQIMLAEDVMAIMHLAAESHVDRSIDGPGVFVETNVVGTVSLLQAALGHMKQMSPARRARFRVHHVSTDEVFGDLPFDGGLFTEETPYRPSSPYSASKAASDHFVRAWHHTYGLPVVLSNCSNNYGPYHFPEKLIPLTILNALEEQPLPVYGRGENVRDWLYVEDHARALTTILTQGQVGESYNVGGSAERTNLAVVETICDLLDARIPPRTVASRRALIRFVADRPGHDRRYAIDGTKLKRDLGWRPQVDFDAGLAQTIDWYLAHEAWWRPLRDRRYAGERLGTAA
ncbi:MAG: dTDP-glucose 4,6-dehydratase [Chakrabartia sp.]